MKKIFFGILGLIALLIVGLFIAAFAFVGEEVTAKRSLYMNSPPPVTYSHVENLKSWEAWSPWKKMDPNMKMEYQNGGVGKGASYTFQSEKENLGNGKLTITDVHKNKSVSTFVEMNGNEGNGYWDFTQKDKGSVVTWSFSYKPKNIMEKIMGLFFDKMMGPSLEDGLAGLKTISEKTPPAGFDIRSSLEQKMQEVKGQYS